MGLVTLIRMWIFTLIRLASLLTILLIVAVAVAWLPPESEVQHTGPSRWRQLYGRMFWVVPTHDERRVAENVISPHEAQQVFEELRFMLHSSYKDEFEQIDYQELDEVEFWSSALKFSPKDCSAEREVSIRTRYSKGLPSKHAMRPNLAVYMNYVKESLLRYCIMNQGEIIIKPIEKIPLKDRTLIAQFSTNTEEPEILWDKIADYFAQYYPSPKYAKSNLATLHRMAHRIYADHIGEPCKLIRSLPELSKNALWYLKRKGQRLAPVVLQWIRTEQTCITIARSMSYLARLMPDAIRRHFKRERPLFSEPEHRLFRGLFRCFAPT